MSLLSADAKTPPKSINTVAFDGFAIFDPAEELFPGRGVALSNAWRTRQFEYTWLRNSLNRNVDFWRVTQDALHYAAAQTEVNLNADQSRQLMEVYLELKPWADVPPALELLVKQNFRLAVLSNLTSMMMRSCVKESLQFGARQYSCDEGRTISEPRSRRLTGLTKVITNQYTSGSIRAVNVSRKLRQANRSTGLSTLD